jgi:23S rRNA (pseudouridine1915-N3)-methyltransferase
LKLFVFIPQKALKGFFREAIKEYEKRLLPYCSSSVMFFSTRDDLLKKLPAAYRINIKAGTDSIDSMCFAQKISEYGNKGISNITYIINSPIASNETLNLSSLNLSDGMLATLLYEQIYRAYRIINNKPYHK